MDVEETEADIQFLPCLGLTFGEVASKAVDSTISINSFNYSIFSFVTLLDNYLNVYYLEYFITQFRSLITVHSSYFEFTFYKINDKSIGFVFFISRVPYLHPISFNILLKLLRESE